MGEKKRADETFKDFRGRAKEGNGTVGGAEMGRFTWFKDGKDKGMFPNSGEVGMVKGKVEEGGKEKETVGAKVFEVESREVVRAKGGGVFGEFDSVSGVRGGEGGEGRREL